MASGGFSSVYVTPATVCPPCAVRKMALRGGAGNKKVVHNNVTYFQAGHVLYDDAGTAGNIDRKGVITMNYVGEQRRRKGVEGNRPLTLQRSEAIIMRIHAFLALLPDC